jgi:glycerol-3-phosphate O-acyltransferase/dihydroxyacetone phosphate acyltransferase
MMLDPMLLCASLPYLRPLDISSNMRPYSGRFPLQSYPPLLEQGSVSHSSPRITLKLYASTASLFVNPVASYILSSSGCIPVDRTSKDRQILFKGTFETLSKGLAVALFPEGTSYTEPRIMQVKEGAAWAALEYTKWLADGKARTPDVIVVPAAIVYTNKSKYRSSVRSVTCSCSWKFDAFY